MDPQTRSEDATYILLLVAAQEETINAQAETISTLETMIGELQTKVTALEALHAP